MAVGSVSPNGRSSALIGVKSSYSGNDNLGGPGVLLCFRSISGITAILAIDRKGCREECQEGRQKGYKINEGQSSIVGACYG